MLREQDVDALSEPRAHAALLVVEIGNSHVAVAAAVDGRIYSHERFEAGRHDETVDYARRVWEAMPQDRLKAVACASVVPKALAELRGPLGKALESPLLVVGEDLQRPMSLAVGSPESVGIDRLCCAAAAYEQVQAACATASFGTAITIDCVNDEGVFMGGAILPGLRLQSRSLHAGTAVLPEVAVEWSGEVYGGDTTAAIRNGILCGVVGAMREITERYATALGAWPQLFVTGGDADLVCKRCDFVDHVVPDLCIRGIGLAYRRHFLPFEER